MQRSCSTCRGRVRGWIGDALTCPRCGSSPGDRLVGLVLPAVRNLLPPLPRTLLVAPPGAHAGLAAQLVAVSGAALHRAGDGPAPWRPDLVVLAGEHDPPATPGLRLPDSDQGGIVITPAAVGPELDALPLRWRTLAASELTDVPARHGIDHTARIRLGVPPPPGYPPMEEIERALTLHAQRRRTRAGIDQLEDLLRRTQDALARTAERHRVADERATDELRAANAELATLRQERLEDAARAAELATELLALGDRSAALERDAARWRRLRRNPVGRGAAAARRTLRRIRPEE